MSGRNIDELFRNKLEPARLQPSEEAWNKLSSRLRPTENNKKFYWGIAAGLALIFSVGLLIGIQMGSQNVNTVASNEIDQKENIESREENRVSGKQTDIGDNSEKTESQVLKDVPETNKVNKEPDTKVTQNLLAQTQTMVEEGNDSNGIIYDTKNDTIDNISKLQIAELDLVNPIISADEMSITSVDFEKVQPGIQKKENPIENGLPEGRGSTLKKMLETARNWKSDNNGWGALREAKNDLLDFNKRKNIGSDD